MIITINTDASFNKKHQVGTYAFWITSNLGRIKRSGILHHASADSTQAEMKCICNALYFIATNKEATTAMKDATRVIVNTDSMNAIHLFTDNKRAVKKYKLNKKSHSRILEKYLYIKKLFIGKEIHFSHVKAHNGTNTPAKWVNDWLDKEAKMQMSKKLYQLTLKKQKNDSIDHPSATNKLHRRPTPAA